MNAAQKKWLEQNPEKAREASREWKKRNVNRIRVYQVAYKARHPERVRVLRRRRNLRTYGLTEEMYSALLASQNGSCAICGSADPRGKRGSKYFHVDHDHSTGAVRGLLCLNCNTALGLFSDSAQVLLKAREYLQK
ncbi:MAG TPA: endonuclease VII domain-containing protein [Stellaceae bacterium]|nr:endonuclease VII domain-containing protein [Terriglobia bacterium]HEV2551790.1 endonuclease VII domain-containing protein [Stellaceae bacterium]